MNQIGSSPARKKSARKTARKAVRRVRGPAGPLVLTDGRPLREQARREYEEARRQLEGMRAEIERFEKEDKPRFIQWLHVRFGRTITEIRETEHKLLALQTLVLEVEEEVFWSEVSHAEAYARVQAEHEEEKLEMAGEPDWDAEDFDIPRGEEASFESNHAGRENGSFGRDSNDGRHDFGGFPFRTEAPPRSAKVKELYRALVRLLHPDLKGEMNAMQQEWWHQAQEAYQSNDPERLESILALCQAEAAVHQETSVSLLERLTRRVRESIARLRTDVALRQREPAWNFSCRPDVEMLDRKTRQMFEKDLARAQQQIARLEAMIERWKKTGRKRRRRCSIQGDFWE